MRPYTIRGGSLDLILGIALETPRTLPLAILNGPRAAEISRPGFQIPKIRISDSGRPVAFPDPLTRSFVRRQNFSFIVILDDADSPGY